MISRYQKTKGFTLIELLVVISIISLLSSIVLSSVSSARDKARIAAGKQFDSYNFDGNDYAYSNNSINFSILNGLTLSAWINVDSCGISGSYCKIIAFGEYYTDLYLLNQSGNIVFG